MSVLVSLGPCAVVDGDDGYIYVVAGRQPEGGECVATRSAFDTAPQAVITRAHHVQRRWIALELADADAGDRYRSAMWLNRSMCAGESFATEVRESIDYALAHGEPECITAVY